MIDKPVTNASTEYCMDMSRAPLGRKVLALNYGHVACFAVLTKASLQYFKGWAPLPKIPKERND